MSKNLEMLIAQKEKQLQQFTPSFQAHVGDAFNLKHLAKLLVQLETDNEMTPQMAEAMEYAKFIPVNQNFSAVIGTSHTLQRKKGVGEGKTYSGTGGDIPLAEVKYDDISLQTQAGAIGYQYSIFELATAGQTGINLQGDKIQAARLGFEKHMSRVAWIGEPEKGLKGLFNQTGVEVKTAKKAWENATPDEILADFNDMLYDALDDTEYQSNITPDTVILPVSLMRVLTSRRIADNLETTLYDWIVKNNAFALQNKPLTIIGSSRPEKLGIGETRRITVYRKDPACIEMRIAQDLTFLAPQPQGLDVFTPGHYLYQGVWLKRVDSLRYCDVPKP